MRLVLAVEVPIACCCNEPKISPFSRRLRDMRIGVVKATIAVTEGRGRWNSETYGRLNDRDGDDSQYSVANCTSFLFPHISFAKRWISSLKIAIR